LIIAVTMVLSPGDPETRHRQVEGKDPMQLAVFPLAVPYLLNPVGIVVLVTLSAEAGSIGHLGIVIGLLAVVLVLDIAVFHWANRVSKHLDASRMLVTEKVFGFLLAAIAVQFILTGSRTSGRSTSTVTDARAAVRVPELMSVESPMGGCPAPPEPLDRDRSVRRWEAPWNGMAPRRTT
jgi:multiple antibiotic resistance protein